MKRLLPYLVASAVSLSSASAAVIRSFEFDGTDLAAANADDFQTRGNMSIAGGLISGVSNATGNRDVQLRVSPFTAVTPAELPSGGLISIRFRESVSESTTVFLDAATLSSTSAAGNNRLFANAASFTNTSAGAPATAVDDGDNFVLATWNVPAGEGFSTLRFDPVNNQGNGSGTSVSFDVDYIRITAIPEPSSLALLGLCGVATIFRRRRSA